MKEELLRVSMRLTKELRRRAALERLRELPGGPRLLRLVDGPIWVRPAGISFEVRVRRVQHASYYMLSHGPEPEIASLMLALVSALPIKTFIDIGANYGYYSWLLHDHSQNPLEIQMFEPDRDNYQLIVSTLSRYRLCNMHACQAAVGDRDGSAPFYADSMTGHRGGLIGRPGLARSSFQVQTRRLDSCLPVSGELALIKIDVEGSEEQVLAGATEHLAARPVIIAECFHKTPDTVQSLLAKLGGYRVMDAIACQTPTRETTHFLAVPLALNDLVLAQVLCDRDRRLQRSTLERGRVPLARAS